MSPYQTIREECCEANRALPRVGLVDLTFGNVSVLDAAAGVFAIKPSGLDYAVLRPEDMVVLDLEEGRVVEGELRCSSDTPTHRCLFRAFPDVRAVVHTHSRRAVAFAQAGVPIPCLGTTHADYFRGPVPVTRHLTAAEIAGDYEWNTGEVIAECFAAGIDPNEIPAVLVRGHGPFAWGPSAAKAVENAQALEIVAEMASEAIKLLGGQPPDDLPTVLRDRHFDRKHGFGAYYGQTKRA